MPMPRPELPASQALALDDQHKVPLVYANVLLANWRALKAAGLSGFTMPGRFFDEVGIDFPVSIGDYRFADTPDDPVLLHLSAVVNRGATGRPAREQAAARPAALDVAELRAHGNRDPRRAAARAGAAWL